LSTREQMAVKRKLLTELSYLTFDD
jgi:hypothetical protein